MITRWDDGISRDLFENNKSVKYLDVNGVGLYYTLKKKFFQIKVIE